MTLRGVSLYAHPTQIGAASRLAEQAGVRLQAIDIHAFPDGESLVKAGPSEATAIVYCSLDRPNEKLVHLLLAASALRDAGARRLVLVAPYMCYMRQDTAFHDGEAVSQRVVGAFLAGLFDRVVTVDPHLHRTRDIGAVFPGCEAQALSSTTLIADALGKDASGGSLVVAGPDSESRQWVERIAGEIGCDFIVGEKQRLGDREVRLEFADVERVRGRPVALVDDIVSSGGTLREAVRRVSDAGATRVDIVAVHAFCDRDAVEALHAAGAASLRSTDAVSHPTNAIWLAPLLAEAIANEGTGG